jgi:hypothetical protein
MTDEDRIMAAMIGSGFNPYLPIASASSHNDPNQHMPNGPMPNQPIPGMNMPSGNVPGTGTGGNMPPAAAGLNPGPTNNPGGPGPGAIGMPSPMSSNQQNSNPMISNTTNTMTKEQMIGQKFAFERPEGPETIKIRFLFPDTSSMSYVFPRNFLIQV